VTATIATATQAGLRPNILEEALVS
jgi:hypothetical protein